MQINVTGKNLDVGEALTNHVIERLNQLRQKYFDGTVHAQVTLEKQRSRFDCDCRLHLATGLIIQAQGQAQDAFKSFDSAARHIEKQLKRYKNRLKEHHKDRHEPVRHHEVADYVIQASSSTGQEPLGLNPVVIAENPARMPELTVGEAVMQLEISSTPFVLFRNSKGGQTSIVYRRSDGNIGWMEPRSAA